jgi:hypothetical protein
MFLHHQPRRTAWHARITGPFEAQNVIRFARTAALTIAPTAPVVPRTPISPGVGGFRAYP